MVLDENCTLRMNTASQLGVKALMLKAKKLKVWAVNTKEEKHLGTLFCVAKIVGGGSNVYRISTPTIFVYGWECGLHELGKVDEKVGLKLRDGIKNLNLKSPNQITHIGVYLIDEDFVNHKTKKSFDIYSVNIEC